MTLLLDVGFVMAVLLEPVASVVGPEVEALTLLTGGGVAQALVKFAPGSFLKSWNGLEIATKASGRAVLGVTK